MIWSRLIASLTWALLVIVMLLNEAVSCDHGLKSLPENFDYGAYAQKYHKSHGNVEALSRASLFYARTLGIIKANMQYIVNKANYYLKQNQYTDMTQREIEQSFVNKDVGLVPVLGSDLFPDTPAEEIANGFDHDGINDGVSRSTLTHVNTKKSHVNFFSDQDTGNVDPRELVREIVEHSEESRLLAKTLELGKARDSDRVLEAFKEANKINHKPMAVPENRNYDPSIVPSRSALNDLTRVTDPFFSSYLMEEYTSRLEPYPTPSFHNKKVLPEDTVNKKGGGLLSGLFQSVKSIYNLLPTKEELFAAEGLASDDADGKITNDKNNDNLKGVKRQQEKLIFDIDWRRTGCISKPKAQLDCNACYIFAPLDLMEYFYCRQKNESTEFSAQYIIDCGGNSKLNGCQAGKLSNVGSFIRDYGLQLSATYPYNGQERQCPFDWGSDDRHKSWAFKPKIVAWQGFNNIKDWYTWIRKRPILVGINMPSDFLAYGGGIHDGADCAPHMVHAMLLVGSGMEDGKTFWLLKNSFSKDWGEGGYFRLSKRAPIKCFDSAIVAIVKFHK